MAGKTEKLLGQPGEIYILSGATRNKINLNRPWQVDLPYAPDTCPFCTKDEPDAMPALPGWRVLENPVTPHAFHRLILPRGCWTREETHELGGRRAISETLQIYAGVQKAAEQKGFYLTVCAAHVGYSAGQNLGHLHWHVCDASLPENPGVEEEIIDARQNNPERMVFVKHDCMVYAEGVRSGQLYIVPPGYDGRGNKHLQNLADTIAEVVALGNRKFRSKQGLAPEYILAVVSTLQTIRYATYIPILAHWGFPQYLAITGDSDLVLPWPHEVTAEYLRSE